MWFICDYFNPHALPTRGPVGLYRSPGVQNFINKVLGFSHKRSSSMMENI